MIVAMSANKAIGKNNDMLIYISDDLKRFKAITSGHAIIMGRKTLLSLPKYPLPNRRNIVITTDENAVFEGCEVVHSVEEALAKVSGEEEAFVIGGGTIYKQLYPHANKLYLTEVHTEFADADVFFDAYDANDWTEESREKMHDTKNNVDYSFVNLKKK